MVDQVIFQHNLDELFPNMSVDTAEKINSIVGAEMNEGIEWRVQKINGDYMLLAEAPGLIIPAEMLSANNHAPREMRYVAILLAGEEMMMELEEMRSHVEEIEPLEDVHDISNTVKYGSLVKALTDQISKEANKAEAYVDGSTAQDVYTGALAWILSAYGRIFPSLENSINVPILRAGGSISIIRQILELQDPEKVAPIVSKRIVVNDGVSDSFLFGINDFSNLEEMANNNENFNIEVDEVILATAGTLKAFIAALEARGIIPEKIILNAPLTAQVGARYLTEWAKKHGVNFEIRTAKRAPVTNQNWYVVDKVGSWPSPENPDGEYVYTGGDGGDITNALRERLMVLSWEDKQRELLRLMHAARKAMDQENKFGDIWAELTPDFVLES